jgi:hypothetical protein
MVDQPWHVVHDLQARTTRCILATWTAEARKAVGSSIDKVSKLCSRAYLSTAGGRVGLSPRNMAAGDWVCIVYGAKVPYILRSRPASAEMEFIGDSYVDGVMYGESLKEGMQSEVFSIE